MTEIKLPSLGTDVDCACGRVHHILTRAIKVEQGVLDGADGRIWPGRALPDCQRQEHL